MKITYLVIVGLFSFLTFVIERAELCLIKIEHYEPPCCTVLPCPYDMETQLANPIVQHCKRDEHCAPRPNRCDSPIDVRIPAIFYPDSQDEPVTFMATIMEHTSHPRCAASILTNRFLVTTCKTCLVDLKLHRILATGSLLVMVGDFDPAEDDGVLHVTHKVERLIIHDGCTDERTYSSVNDIGLVKTTDAIVFNKYANPAIIPSRAGFLPSYRKTWYLSKFRPKNTIATTLKEGVWYIKVRSVTKEQCETALNRSSYYDRMHHHCTNYQHEPHDGYCRDDFGASISYDNILFGILIHKYGCGRKGAAAAFVNVAQHKDWIESKIKYFGHGQESLRLS